MIENRVVPIDFGGGVDTKTDPKLVVPGKWLRVENGVFTSPRRIAKRNGYSGLSTTLANVGAMSAPTMTHEFNGELLCADQNYLFSYSPSQTAWISRGNYVSTELTRTSIDNARPTSGFCDVAVMGNYALYGWSTAAQQNITPNVYSGVYGSVVDTQTGAAVAGPILLSTATGNFINTVRCVKLGSTALAIIYKKPDQTALYLRVVSFAGSGVVAFGSEQTITTSYDPTYKLGFDVINTSTGAALAYFTTTGVRVALIDTTGAVTATTHIVDANANQTLCLSATSNGNLWVYWVDSDYGFAPATNATIVYAVFSSALAAVLAKTTVKVLASPFMVTNMMTVSTSATAQTLYYGIYETTGATNCYIDDTYYITATSGGSVGTATIFSTGVAPYSRSFTVGSTDYAVMLYRGATLNYVSGNVAQLQPTFFVVRLAAPTATNPLVVARFGSGVANSQATLGVVIGFTPSVSLQSGSKLLFACGIETQEYLSDAFSALEYFPGGFSGAFSYSIDFAGANSYRAVNAGNLALLNGGVVQNYDGQAVSEWGFHLYPEVPGADQGNAGTGHIAAGAYSYIAIYQWVDAQGNLHQSAPSTPLAVTIAPGNNYARLHITTAFLSQKSGVTVAVYRTQAGGSVYYLVSDPVFVTSASAVSASTILFTDNLADASLLGNPQAYTYPASSVLENSAPPPSMYIVAHDNRAWFMNAEDGTAWYTKSFIPGTGLSPSAFLTQQIDPKLGRVVALAEMDDKLIFLKEQGFAIQSGDGANDSGTGSSLTSPQFVPSDVGCSGQKSVVSTPNGIMFKSANGIYLLNRAVGVQYIGAEVEAYNAQTVTDARLIPGKTQIRFLCSSGYTLVYDYLLNQWSTFTNHTGVSATIWQSTYVYTNGTRVFQESASIYTDNGTAYNLLAQTSWLALASVQGFERVRRIAMLGDFVNGSSGNHKVSITPAYDFGAAGSAVLYTLGSASASGVFQYRERLVQQKCDALSLLIQEVSTGDSAEFIDFTNLSLEVGVKRGINKLAASQSIA